MAGMARLNFDRPDPSRHILLLGAHCDDIEIGCGATLVELAGRWPEAEFHAVIFCSDDEREAEARASLERLIGDRASLSMTFGGLKDGFLPYRAEEAKTFLVQAVKGLSPDIVFTHCTRDLHQDHRFVAEITYQALRDSLILEMEIPKYDGDLGRTNLYFPVSRAAADHKISTLMTCYPTQASKPWFSEDTFASLLRIRGVECRSESGLAEAFYGSKLVLA